MLLVEEWLERHQVKVPQIKYVSTASVFFKDEQHPGWHIKFMQWHPPDMHPGTYTSHLYRPVHNGLERGRVLENAGGEMHLQWDEYEAHLLHWASTPCCCVPRTREETVVASWEVLLRCCDRGLIRHMHYDTLSASIDTSVEAAQRCVLIEECLQYFSVNHPDIVRLWDGDLRPHRENHALWLAEMVAVK